MCDLCNPQTREAAIRRSRDIASGLRTLAADYEKMAEGKIEPHTKAVEIVVLRSKSVIRALVEDWV